MALVYKGTLNGEQAWLSATLSEACVIDPLINKLFLLQVAIKQLKTLTSLQMQSTDAIQDEDFEKDEQLKEYLNSFSEFRHEVWILRYKGFLYYPFYSSGLLTFV